MGDKFRQLGEKILSDHVAVAAKTENCDGVLTGPMFSHLIGNLVLREVDVRMNEAMPGTGDGANGSDDELNRFALWDKGRELMKSQDPFIRELACLHGVGNGRRHASVFDLAFDPDEQLAFDAIAQMQPSSYF
jgi:hypothetical protein